MSRRIRVAAQCDIVSGKPLAFEYDRHKIAVFNLDGRILAISNICPHAGSTLIDGFIENGRITCQWHGWSFPLAPEDAPDDCLARYAVHLLDDDVYVDFPEEPALGWG